MQERSRMVAVAAVALLLVLALGIGPGLGSPSPVEAQTTTTTTPPFTGSAWCDSSYIDFDPPCSTGLGGSGYSAVIVPPGDPRIDRTVGTPIVRAPDGQPLGDAFELGPEYDPWGEFWTNTSPLPLRLTGVMYGGVPGTAGTLRVTVQQPGGAWVVAGSAPFEAGPASSPTCTGYGCSFHQVFPTDVTVTVEPGQSYLLTIESDAIFTSESFRSLPFGVADWGQVARGRYGAHLGDPAAAFPGSGHFVQAGPAGYLGPLVIDDVTSTTTTVPGGGSGDSGDDYAEDNPFPDEPELPAECDGTWDGERILLCQLIMVVHSTSEAIWSAVVFFGGLNADIAMEQTNLLEDLVDLFGGFDNGLADVVSAVFATGVTVSSAVSSSGSAVVAEVDSVGNQIVAALADLSLDVTVEGDSGSPFWEPLLSFLSSVVSSFLTAVTTITTTIITEVGDLLEQLLEQIPALFVPSQEKTTELVDEVSDVPIVQAGGELAMLPANAVASAQAGGGGCVGAEMNFRGEVISLCEAAGAATAGASGSPIRNVVLAAMSVGVLYAVWSRISHHLEH